MTGISPRNLKYMRAFAAAWPDAEIVQRVVAQFPWRQNIALLELEAVPEEQSGIRRICELYDADVPMKEICAMLDE